MWTRRQLCCHYLEFLIAATETMHYSLKYKKVSQLTAQVFLVPVFAVQQVEAVLVGSCSRHVDSDRQSLWQFFLAGVFYDQNVITRGRQTPVQLDADLQQKQENSH